MEESLFKKILLFLLKLINLILYKKDQIVIFSNDFESGNAIILYTYLKKRINKKIILLNVKDKNIINVHSLRGVYVLLTSRFIISSHSPFRFKSKKQLLIHLWHGIPIKNLDNYQYEKYIDIQCSHSKFVDNIYISCWNLKQKQLKHISEPIYDKLKCPEKFLTQWEKKRIQQVILKQRQNVLYVPTYRHSIYSKEGQKITEILREFLRVVEKNKDKNFIIKLHPYEFSKEENLKILEKCNNVKFSNLPTEDILPGSDFLITDCSSIYYWGIFLKKDILIFFPDYENYKETRGFITDFDRIVPQDIITYSYIELDLLLNNYNEENKNSIKELNKMIFPKDINSCKEILKIIQKK